MPSISELLGQVGIFAAGSMAIGVVPLVVAIAYAVRPTEQKLLYMRPLSLATVFAGICGFTAGAAIVLQGLAVTSPGAINMSALYRGMAETVIPVFVSFGFLAAAWLLVTAGMLRRQP